MFVVGIVLVTAVVATAYVAVTWSTRELPDYSWIEDGIYLGSAVDLPPRGTAAVLNLCEVEDRYQVEIARWEPIPDAAPAPTLDWLDGQVDFIDAQQSAGRQVYVHCRNGVSRSAMVTAAWLMSRHRWSRDEALEFLRSKRPGIRPHPAFLELLAEWDELLKTAASEANFDRP